MVIPEYKPRFSFTRNGVLYLEKKILPPNTLKEEEE